MGGMGMPN